MNDDQCVANGIPFEQRCQAAQDTLEATWTLVQQLTADDLAFLQNLEEENARRKSESSNPVVHALLDESATGRHEVATSSSQQFTKLAWEGMIQSCRRVYGDSATDFALAALNKNTKKN